MTRVSSIHEPGAARTLRREHQSTCCLRPLRDRCVSLSPAGDAELFPIPNGAVLSKRPIPLNPTPHDDHFFRELSSLFPESIFKPNERKSEF
jgi:hypothetical protein